MGRSRSLSKELGFFFMSVLYWFSLLLLAGFAVQNPAPAPLPRSSPAEYPLG